MPVRVIDVADHSTAKDAGIEIGDLILTINNHPITQIEEAMYAEHLAEPVGGITVLKTLRDGREIEITLPRGPTGLRCAGVNAGKEEHRTLDKPANDSGNTTSGVAGDQHSDSAEKACPFCAEIIKQAAKKCRWCGETLEQIAATAVLEKAPMDAYTEVFLNSCAFGLIAVVAAWFFLGWHNWIVLLIIFLAVSGGMYTVILEAKMVNLQGETVREIRKGHSKK